MQNGLSSKDLNILEDQLTHEALANQKAAAYAESIQDPQLSALARTLASHHKHRYEMMYNYLNSQQ